MVADREFKMVNRSNVYKNSEIKIIISWILHGLSYKKLKFFWQNKEEHYVGESDNW